MDQIMREDELFAVGCFYFKLNSLINSRNMCHWYKEGHS